jgi:hypothetical protein
MERERVFKKAGLVVWCIALPLVVLAASCATMTPEGSPETGYKIEGFVGKSTTQPAVAENVVLVDARSGEAIGNVQTNVFGKYSFAGLGPGQYVIKVGKVSREVVIASKSVRLDIDLSAEGGVMDYGKTGREEIASGGGGGTDAAPTDAGQGDSQLTAQLAGSYYGYTGSTETRLMLRKDGAFSLNTESSYSNVEGSDIAWGAASQGSNRGRWSAQGTAQQGRITLAYANGKKQVVQYRYDSSKGCYYFDGTLLCRE